MSLSPTKTSLSFDVTVDDADSIGDITKVTLSQNDTLVEEILGQSEGTFENLFTNNTYVVKAYYSYQFDEESDLYEETEEQTGVTLANLTPTFTFTDVVPGQEDIVFEYTVTDTDEVGSLTKIELLKGTEVVETLTEYESTMFEDLLSNNDYQLKATYTYDLNDGTGVKMVVVIQNIRTKAKMVPSIKIFDVKSGKEHINFNIDIDDADQTGDIGAIEVFKGNELVSMYDRFDPLEWPDEFTFSGLLSNTEYVIRVIFVYDLNEGTGVVTISDTYQIKTRILPGEGTEQSPYLIQTVEDFMVIKDDPEGHFKLLNDINFTGLNFDTMPVFSGYLDGGNFSLINISKTIDIEFESNKLALFEYSYGTITNLIIENYSANFDGYGSIVYGSIVNFNYGELKNISFSGEINVNLVSGNFTGGALAGKNYGKISYINVFVEFNAYASGSSFIGGVAGESFDGLFEKTSIIGTFSNKTGQSGYPSIGGVVGTVLGTRTKIQDVFTNVNIYIDKENHDYGGAGSVVGRLRFGGAVIERVIALGQVRKNPARSSLHVGGITGEIWNGSFNESVIIRNILTLVDVDSNGFNSLITGSQRTDGEGSIIVFNAHHINSLSNQHNLVNSNEVDFENLNQASWFVINLKLNEEIWDFTGLDIANGVYPTLKNMPEIPVEE